MSDRILETLQEDVFQVLKATPALVRANILLNEAETTESTIVNAIKTLTATGGKRGLALVVLRPEVTEADQNLPGPPLTLKIEIQCVEQPLLNRATADGTLVRSSQAAINALSALHLRHMGDYFLYAEKNPIQAVQVKPGYVSDAVTVFAKYQAMVTPKPLQVQPTMAASTAILVSGTLSPDITGVWTYLSVFGQDTWVKGTGPSGSILQRVTEGAETFWNMARTDGTYLAKNFVTETSPIGLYDWVVLTGTGQPAIAAAEQLQLSCASAGSSIRYTTDGSYPSPSKTLYTAPIVNPTVGAVCRAAAYVSGMPPSDVLEFTIT